LLQLIAGYYRNWHQPQAVMPEVDQGIGERFERVMHLTEALEAKQDAAKRVFPRE